MSNFCTDMSPEEPTPADVKDCKECGLYKHGTPMVWGEVGGIQTAVAYRPLAVWRHPNLQSLFLEDWRFIADKYLNTKHQYLFHSKNTISLYSRNAKKDVHQ